MKIVVNVARSTHARNARCYCDGSVLTNDSHGMPARIARGTQPEHDVTSTNPTYVGKVWCPILQRLHAPDIILVWFRPTRLQSNIKQWTLFREKIQQTYRGHRRTWATSRIYSLRALPIYAPTRNIEYGYSFSPNQQCVDRNQLDLGAALVGQNSSSFGGPSGGILREGGHGHIFGDSF